MLQFGYINCLETICMIEFSEVTKAYAVGTQALRGVSMQIEDGEFAFLVGPSGSGKSTIIKLITGELKPTSGTVHVNGYSLERIRKREIPYMRRTVGVVFQDFRLIENKTVLSDEFRPVAYDCFKFFRCLGFEYTVVECIAHYELVYDAEPFGYDFTTFLILVLKQCQFFPFQHESVDQIL